jgi:hypothetical protein
MANTENPLSIMAPYDDATRGPLGSFILLLQLPKRYGSSKLSRGSLFVRLLTTLSSIVVSVVATITVLALGFEPFVQQSLSLPLRNLEVPGSSPTIPTVTNLALSEAELASNITLVYNSVLLRGLFSDAMPPLQPLCTGTYCEWPAYYTAGVCSSCEDLLNDTTMILVEEDKQAVLDFATADYLDAFPGFDTLEQEENMVGTVNMTYAVTSNYTIRLGDAPPFNLSVFLRSSLNEFSQLYQTLDFPEEVVFDATKRPTWVSNGHNGILGGLSPNITGPLSTLGYLALARSEDGMRLELRSATRCAISLCAREEVTKISNGTLETIVKDQTWGHHFQFGVLPDQGYNWTATLGDHTFHVVDKPDNAYDHTAVSLDNTIMSLRGRSWRRLDANNKVSQHSLPTDPTPNTKRFMTGDVMNSSARIAQTFTNHLRENGDEEIQGQVYTSVPFVDVRWPWLVYPLTIVTVCSAMLLITIYQTKRCGLPIWRTSLYPLLFAYHIENDRRPSMIHSSERSFTMQKGQVVTTSRGRTDAGRPLLRRSPVRTDDSVSTFELTAKHTEIQLVRSDERWVFEKVKSQ